MSKYSTIEDFRYDINKEIQNGGIKTIAVSNACECAICKKEGRVPSDGFTDIFDGYVYSIGLHKKGLPEILVLCGSSGFNEDSLTAKQISDRIIRADAFVKHISENIETLDFNGKKTYSSGIDNLQWVMKEGEIEFSAFVKNDLMHHATAYYDSYDYNVIMFIPHIHYLEDYLGDY